MIRLPRGGAILLAATVALAAPSPNGHVSSAAAAAPPPPWSAKPQASCTMSDENRSLIQEGLDAWERISGEYLELDRLPLPWMVLFDTSCVWHLAADEEVLGAAQPVDVSFRFAGEEVPVRARPHDGTVELPSGAEVPARGLGFASLYDDGRAPFFVMALLDIWRQIPGFEEAVDLHEHFLGVMSHEIVHTRQLVAVNERVDELGERYELPDNVSDDLIEERFADVPGYAAAYEAESGLFYEAVAEDDPRRRRELVAEALRLVHDRHQRYFSGDAEVFRDIDALFLNMEGVAVWAAYRLLRADAGAGFRAESPGFERDRNTWTQDEGLPLFLLLEAMVPGWRPRVLGPELASPFELLQEVVDPGPA